MFENRQELVKTIIMLQDQHGISAIEAIVHISEKYHIDIETMALYIKQAHKIKETLRLEAVGLNMMK